MKCPHCEKENKVKETRVSTTIGQEVSRMLKRFRVCEHCSYRFPTLEVAMGHENFTPLQSYYKKQSKVERARLKRENE